MVESRRKEGSATLCFFKKGRTKDSKRQKVWWWIAIVAVIVVTILLAVMIKNYARRNGCESVFWGTIGNYVIGVAAVEILVTFIANQITQNQSSQDQLTQEELAKKRKHRIVSIILVSFITLAILLALFDLVAYGLVKEQILKQKETSTSTPGNSTEIEEETPAIHVIPYDVDQDPFMEEKSLKEYYGKDVLDDNTEEIKGEVLWNNLYNNMPEGESSKNYNRLRDIADAEYDTYLYEKKRDESSNSVELFENRIGRLQQSLEHREEADGECQAPENERPIATGYKEKGDEYFRQEKQSDAIDAYEKSAEWFMRAICHAAAVGDDEEVLLCMEKFTKLNEEVKKLDEISSDRKDKISNMVEAYEFFVERLQEGWK